MATILVLHGPNLNLLGLREPQHYGTQTLANINDTLLSAAKAMGHELKIYQENAEHALIQHIHRAYGYVDFIIFNPAAYTHTSIALRDALLAVNIPFIEVHLSDIHRRESFRHRSYLSDIAYRVMIGSDSYSQALTIAHTALSSATIE